MDQQLNATLNYIEAELNRIQTIAGTLASIEKQHQQQLLNLDDERLNQMANEEQSAARQLGEVKQICLSLAQKVRELAQRVNELH